MLNNIKRITLFFLLAAFSPVHLHSDYVVTRLDLYDPQGRHLEFLSYPGLNTDLDLSRYPSGLYHLVITTSQGITTKQIIKK